jgi:hypothetical protein
LNLESSEKGLVTYKHTREFLCKWETNNEYLYYIDFRSKSDTKRGKDYVMAKG